MILVEGQASDVKAIHLTHKNGKKIQLTEDSDPKDLFLALEELARYIVRDGIKKK